MRASLIALLLLGACTRTTTWTYYPDTGGASDVDADGDGFTPNDGDCDDDDAEIHPDATELCDGINNDCDGGVDEDASDGQLFYMDGDGDGFGNDAATITACSQPPGFIERGGDCDDAAPTANPAADEICNDGIDNNCNNDQTECALEGTIPLGEAHARILGEAPGDRFGGTLAGAGDINGDGLDDLAISAIRNDANGYDSGAVFLFFGPVSGQLVASDASAQLNGVSSGHQAGASLAPIDDVDGDGYDELLVGAPRAKAGGNDAGEIYLMHGPVSGQVSLAEAHLRLVGEIAYDVAGTSVSGLSDVTGDGVADLLVGATGYGDGGFQNRGAAYLVSGAASGLVDLSDAQARIMGEQRFDRLGTDVTDPGDVNGDGVGDLLVSGYTWPGNDAIGAAFLFLGPLSGNVNAVDADAIYQGEGEDLQAASAIAAGDLDGDGHRELVVASKLVTTTDDEEGAVYVVEGPASTSGPVTRELSDSLAVIHGTTRRDRIGDSLAAGALVDRGEAGELLIGGAEADSEEAVDSGVAWLFYGPVEGSHTTDDADVTMPGEVGRDAAGTAVAFAGDTNGDELEDLLVGALNQDAGGTDAGAAYLVIGTSW